MKYFILFLFATLHFTQIEAQIIDSTQVKQPNRWMKPLIVVGYAGATYVSYKYLDQKWQDESQEGKNKSKTMIAQMANPFGVGKYNFIAISTVTCFSFLTKNKKLQKTAVIWLGSAAINSFVVNQMKITFQRHRPSTGDQYNTFDWRSGLRSNNSFPSAHTANVFTAATVFATLYKDHKWVPAVAYSIATLTGLSRIYNNAHWASDVMAGAAIGFLSAKAMIKIYTKVNQKLMILPGVTRNCINVNFVCNLY